MRREDRSSNSQGIRPSSYIPSLDGLRAIAFFCVFGAHSTANSVSKLIPATFGVTMFFFLSGYLITTLLRSEAQDTGTIVLKDFYIRRALRIFIPMYIAYALAALLSKIVWGLTPGTLEGAFSALFYYYNYARLLLPHAFVPEGLDVTWSLGVEEHFYLIFPLLYLTFIRRKVSVVRQAQFLLALCLLGLAWRNYVFYHHFPALWTYYTTDCRFDSILWGSLLAIWNNPALDTPSAWQRRWSGWMALAGFLTLLGTMTLSSWAFRQTFRYSIQGACLYFIFYFVVAHSGHWTTRWLSNRALRYVGWLSYSMYLFHDFIIDRMKAGLHAPDWLISPVSFALVFLYAYTIRQAVELPLQRLRARFRHTPPPVAADMGVEGI